MQRGKTRLITRWDAERDKREQWTDMEKEINQTEREKARKQNRYRRGEAERKTKVKNIQNRNTCRTHTKAEGITDMRE